MIHLNYNSSTDIVATILFDGYSRETGKNAEFTRNFFGFHMSSISTLFIGVGVIFEWFMAAAKNMSRCWISHIYPIFDITAERIEHLYLFKQNSYSDWKEIPEWESFLFEFFAFIFGKEQSRNWKHILKKITLFAGRWDRV